MANFDRENFANALWGICSTLVIIAATITVGLAGSSCERANEMRRIEIMRAKTSCVETCTEKIADIPHTLQICIDGCTRHQ